MLDAGYLINGKTIGCFASIRSLSSSIKYRFLFLSSIDSFFLITQVVSQQFPGVDVLVAIDAEILPVAAVRGVIEVVAVLMVDRQQMPLSGSKFTATAGTDQVMDRQGPFPIIILGEIF